VAGFDRIGTREACHATRRTLDSWRGCFALITVVNEQHLANPISEVLGVGGCLDVHETYHYRRLLGLFEPYRSSTNS